ncbi:hypothetical protein TruAng_006422 [Truncatella angustata]|nr:hypothetical protein TruAng_006422 [Truncatella angustata]
MATNKRRKIDAAEQPQAQSAVARLRNLRSQAVPSPSPVHTESPGQQAQSIAAIEFQASPTPKTPKKARAAKTTSATQEALPPDDNLQPETGGAATPYAPRGDAEFLAKSPPLQQTPVVQFSSFAPNKSNFKKKPAGRLQLRLSEGERLVVLGSYGITVTSGEITFQGAILRSGIKTRWVHAPHCHALPVIRCPEEATIELQPCAAAQGLRQLGKLSPLFRKLWNESSTMGDATSGDSTFTILYTSADGPRKVLLADLKSPPEWNREIDKLLMASRSKPLSVIVTGPKSAGKSTFGRLLSNQLSTDRSDKRKTNSIAVLDLDPGQPEYGPPGQISLVKVAVPNLSPSFCRPQPMSTTGSDVSVIRSHTLASVSPASDPDLYLAAVTDLITHYRNRLASSCLIVNTPGWIQGTGLDLLTSVIELVRPSHVIYMASGPLDVIETLQSSFKNGLLTTLPSQTTQYTTRTAAHLRTMQTMSYFHSEIQAGVQMWNVKPLSAIPPWQVQYSGPTPGILGIMCYDYQSPANIMADAINGTILAMVEIESLSAILTTSNEVDDSLEAGNMGMDDDKADSLNNVLADIVTHTPENIPLIRSGITLDPKHSHTIGLALLRGVDKVNQVFHILSPVPDKQIKQIYEKGNHIVLVSGKLDPPSWAYTEDLYNQTSNASEDTVDEQMDIIEEDEALDSDHETTNEDLDSASMPTPWIEVLRANQKRGTGSQVWRVRRDLGRNNAN